jgi:lipoprotein-releasing system ATP-binding protein
MAAWTFSLPNRYLFYCPASGGQWDKQCLKFVSNAFSGIERQDSQQVVNRARLRPSSGKISCLLPGTCRNHLPMRAPATLLKLNDVTKSYAAAGGADEVRVLSAVSLEVARGETLAIVGPSGSGKSTLLQIIGTLDRPTSGQVLLDGNDLGQLDDLQLAEVRNRQMGFVFQAHYLLPQCTVMENVLVPTLASTKSEIQNSKSEPAAARAERLLKRVGLLDRLHHRPGQLSGGERQRVAVIRALINQPQLLLADEPTGALDHISATALGQLLVELNEEEGVTLVVVTHAMDLAKRMGRVLELGDGKLVQR